MDQGKITEKQFVFRITAFHSSVWWSVVSSAEDFHVQVYAAPPVPPLPPPPHFPSESLSFFLIAIFIIINQLPAGHEAGSLGIFLRPTSSCSFPNSHTPSWTSLTFPPLLPHRLSCSLSPAFKLPPSPQLCVNWFALCVMQMFGSGNVAFSVESVQPCVYMDSALLTIKHCFVLLLLKVSVLHRETTGNFKRYETLIVKNFQNIGEILQCVIHVMVYGLTTDLWGFFLHISSGLTFCLFSYPCRLLPKSDSHQYARVSFGRSEVCDHTLITAQDLCRDLWPQGPPWSQDKWNNLKRSNETFPLKYFFPVNKTQILL